MTTDDGGDPLAELIADLDPRGTPQELADGEVLCREGEVSTGAFVVRSGCLEAIVDVDGVDMVVAEHGPGTLVGEVTTVVGGPRSATLRARSDTVVSVLDKPVLARWLDDHPEAALTVLDLARTRTDRNRAASLLSEHLGVTDRDLAVAMAERLVIESYPAGVELIAAGSIPTRAAVIISGRIVLTGTDGQRLDRVRGQVFGQEAMFDETSALGAETTRPATIGWLSKDDFVSLTSAHPLGIVSLVRRLSTASAPSASHRLGRSVAVITEGPDGRALADGMFRAIADRSDALLLDPETVDSLLSTPGVARRSPDQPGTRRVEELFHQVELDHDVVLLHAEVGDRAWIERAVLHADHVVVWTDGRPSQAVEGLLDQIRALGAAAPILLAIRHRVGAELPTGTAALRQRLGLDEVLHARGGRDDDVARVGRLAAGLGFGLVLSGGGGRGFAHLGAVRSLREREVPIDRVAGASMGAVIAGAIALGYEGEELVALVERQFRRLLDYTVPLVSVLKGERIATNIVQIFGDCEIEDLWIPFGCVTTNLTRNRVEVHRTGRLDLAVRASVAIPGILPPVPNGEDLLVDGGVLDNLPLDLMTEDRSVGTVIAVDVAPPRGPTAKADFGLSVSGWSAVRDRWPRGRRRLPSLGSVLMRSMTVGSAWQRDQRLATGAATLYLYLDLAGVGLLDFESVRQVAERGYEAADPEIAAWLRSDR